MMVAILIVAHVHMRAVTNSEILMDIMAGTHSGSPTS
jgi:hypothetical protein